MRSILMIITIIIIITLIIIIMIIIIILHTTGKRHDTVRCSRIFQMTVESSRFL